VPSCLDDKTPHNGERRRKQLEEKTVSTILLAMLLVGMLTFAFKIEQVCAVEYPAVCVDPETTVNQTLTPGLNYTASIMTDYTGDDITGYQFTLTYNPYVLHITSVDNGDLVTGPLATFKVGPIDNVAGKLNNTGAYFFVAGFVVSGPGTLATVTFEVVGIGKSNITIGTAIQLVGWNATGGYAYLIVDGKTMSNHIQHGFFNNVQPIHDVAVTRVVVPTTMVIIGQLVSNIDVVVANEGNFTETFSVTAYTNTTLIGTQKDITLESGIITTLTFNWDTTDLVVGDCTITAEAILAGDADPVDNHASTTVIVAPGALNPVPPGYYETSEYLIGSVAVGVILPESNGTIDPSTEDWTSTEESQMISAVEAGLDWWAAYNPSANVSFSIEVHYRVPTSYEPTYHLTENLLWISEAMTYLGYPSTYYNYHEQVRDYINDLRDRLGTNWAFAIFLIDSSTSGFDSAYAYLGGPIFVMTYASGATIAHEMGHIFYATDEYNGHEEYSGYLNVPDNDYVQCLMNLNAWELCDATQGQIGWRDTDGDGILDIVDTVPDTTLNPYLPDPTANNILTYTGSATVAAYPNQSPFWWYERRNITINTITNVEYRIDSGTWMNATPTDGAFDETQETFTFTTPSLSRGVHTIEVCGTNSVGNVETSYASDVVTIALPTVTATVNIHPHMLNLRSKGKWITAHIELPEGYNLEDIDVSTIMLNDVVTAESSQVTRRKLRVRFDRSEVIALLPQIGEAELTITGTLFIGTPFEGSDTIRVKCMHAVAQNYGQTFSLLSLTGIIAVAGVHQYKKRKQPN